MRRDFSAGLSGLLFCAILLPACTQDFDDEFAEKQQDIEAQARELDQQLSDQMASELGEDGLDRGKAQKQKD